MNKVKPKSTVIPERDILAGVLQALRVFGIDAARQNTGAATNPRGQVVRFSQKGAADVSATLPDGRRLEIECKRVGKRPTREQYDRMHRINASNGVSFWVNDAQQVIDVLPKLIAGARVEIDEAGMPWVTDEKMTERASR